MLYWTGEFIKVAVTYGLTVFLWPCVVFHGWLKGKSRTYGFAFCTLGMLLLINMVVLGLGLIPGALKDWLICVLFYGVFLVQLFRLCRGKIRQAWNALERLSAGTFGNRNFFYRLAGQAGAGFRALFCRLISFFRGHLPEYGIMGALCVYAVMYFGVGAFDLHSFGFSDLYVHHSWIYGLQTGKIFSSGIYPEGMHTFIYLLSTVSGVRAYSFLLFLGSLNTAMLMVSVWIFFREIFHWKYMPFLAILLFLILDHTFTNEIAAMSRLQCTLPQEFAMPAEFLCAAFLIRYLKYGRGQHREQKILIGRRRGTVRISRFYKDENLRMFSWAIAVSFAVHFYITIMAAVICVAVVPAFLDRIFRKKYFFPILLAVFLGILVPLLPMAGAFAEGTPLQGSIGWGISVIKGTNQASSSDEAQQTQKQQSNNKENSSSGKAEAETKEQTGGETQETEGLQKGTESGKSLQERVHEKAKLFYNSSYHTVYGSRGRLFAALSVSGIFLPLLLHFVLWLIPPARRGRRIADGYFILCFSALLFMGMYAAGSLGLPRLVDGIRVLSTEKILLCGVCFWIPDLLFAAVRQYAPAGAQESRKERIRLRKNANAGVFLAAAAACCIFIVRTGSFHGYLYYEMSRYPEAVDVSNEIIRSVPKESFTIVSTTEELYQVIYYGYHEELLTLVKMNEAYPGYTIPSRYIFVFVEKQPLIYGQHYFFRGPAWLGETGKYYRFFKKKNITASQSPAALHTVISKKAAGQALKFQIGDSAAARDTQGRTTMESRADLWIKSFQDNYPGDCSVFFEDSRFICYRIVQDPQIPDKLGFGTDRYGRRLK